MLGPLSQSQYLRRISVRRERNYDRATNEPAEPLNPEMNALRLSHSAGYSLKSGKSSYFEPGLQSDGPRLLRWSSLGTIYASTLCSAMCLRRAASLSAVSTVCVPMVPIVDNGQ